MKALFKESRLGLRMYTPVGEADEKEVDFFLEEDQEQQRPQLQSPGAKMPWGWIASTAFFVFTTLTALLIRDNCKSGCYETGFMTDLG
jgi:hypothetical protein